MLNYVYVLHSTHAAYSKIDWIDGLDLPKLCWTGLLDIPSLSNMGLNSLSSTAFIVLQILICTATPSIVFCCIAAWIQPDISGCQQGFLVVSRWNQLRTFQGIFENNFIVQENTLKFSKLIHFYLGNKKLSLNQNVLCDHATMQQDVLLHFWLIFLYWN